MQYVTYVDKNGNDVKSQWEYMFGETLISVQDGNSTVYYKFILKDYAEYYAEPKNGYISQRKYYCGNVRL